MTRYYQQSGFLGRGTDLRRDAPRDWIVWHFTHVNNLPAIVSQGRLLPDSAVTPATDVANEGVKARRRSKPVNPHADYPPSMVSDHVPFYIAAKSPMLYVVCRGFGQYKGGPGPLVLMGVALGDIIDAGLTWCASDGNAAAEYTGFSCDLDQLGKFVDYHLMCRRDWDNTADDLDRQNRRSAEILVHGAVPVDLISYVGTSTPQTMDTAHRLLSTVGGIRKYRVKSEMYY